MSWVKVTRILDRDRAIDGLVQLRREWQEAANGVPLAEVNGSIGLLLVDVANAMGLTTEEAAQVLGSETFVDAAQMKFREFVR